VRQLATTACQRALASERKLLPHEEINPQPYHFAATYINREFQKLEVIWSIAIEGGNLDGPIGL